MSGDTADSTPAPAGALRNEVTHDRPVFVAPRTYLEQGRPAMSQRALTAVDREQLDGLVRDIPWNLEPGQLSLRLMDLIEDDPRFLESANELRCATAQLSADCL
jgi:hypothetical protein